MRMTETRPAETDANEEIKWKAELDAVAHSHSGSRCAAPTQVWQVFAGQKRDGGRQHIAHGY